MRAFIPARAGRAAALAALALLLSACASRVDMGAVEPIAFDRAEALSAVNAYRAGNGLPALSIDRRLTAAAEAQSAAMAARDDLGHDVAGKLPARVQSFGYDWAATAENIGRGYPDMDAALAGWIGSAGHRKNLLNPAVRSIGFAGARARAGGRPYWTQIFGAERAPRGPSPSEGRPLTGGGSLRFP